VCCLILWDGDIHQYCSEAFDPLLNHTGILSSVVHCVISLEIYFLSFFFFSGDIDGGPEGRKVIAKLLMGKRQGKESETPSRPIPGITTTYVIVIHLSSKYVSLHSLKMG
jgi:hypothetical protein